MSRRSKQDRAEHQRAILAHHAHLPLLRGMARGIEQVLPPDFRYLIVTFTPKGTPGGYISNAETRITRQAIRHAFGGIASSNPRAVIAAKAGTQL